LVRCDARLCFFSCGLETSQVFKTCEVCERSGKRPACDTSLLFNSLEALFDSLEALFDSLEALFDSLEALFDSLEPLCDSLEALCDSLEPLFDSLEPFIDLPNCFFGSS
jgi:hypothetical protein